MLVLFYDRAARLLQPIRDAAQSDWQLEEWRLGDSAARLEELLALAVVIVAGPGFPASALGKTRNLRLLQCASAGYEWIDFDAVPPTAHVCNTSSMDASIAEYVLCAILEWQVGCMRADRALRAARCIVPPFGAPGQRGLAPFHGEAGGKTLGIVGLGAIGEQVARRAAALDMRVLATTGRPRRATQPLPQGVAWRGAGDGADLERLLRESDFVVLCCALTPATRGLIDERRLALLKPTAVLINVGRGGLCEERPLYEAVRDRRIGGAVLDVWWQYPSVESGETWPSQFPFHELTNVVMTPHCSGWTAEQEVRKREQVVSNIAAVASGELPLHCLRQAIR